ncbi:hypothetical protein [Pseudomonas phage PJNP013]|uniref:Uncharacterized protein n=1 Tax=Pseudomonas phage PJNP013 TaxID=3108093 RepID=A0ABZ2CNV1_9CAUD
MPFKTATPAQVRELRNASKALDQACQPVVQGTEPLPLAEDYRTKLANYGLREADALRALNVIDSDEGHLGEGDRVVNVSQSYKLHSGVQTADVVIRDDPAGVAFDFKTPTVALIRDSLFYPLQQWDGARFGVQDYGGQTVRALVDADADARHLRVNTDLGYYVRRGRKGYVAKTGLPGTWYRRADGSTIQGTFAFHPHEGGCFTMEEQDIWHEERSVTIKTGTRSAQATIQDGAVVPIIVNSKRTTLLTEGTTFTIGGKTYTVAIDINHSITFEETN